MRLTREEVEHVALLGRLNPTEGDLARYTDQLNNILDHFAQLQEADTSSIAGTTTAVSMLNVNRADENITSFTPDEALQNAPERVHDLFKVPRVVE